MYVSSYNQVSHTTGNYKLGATYRATDYPGYNSMYCGRKGSKGDYWWWLASPSASTSSYVCGVDSDGAALGDGGCSNSLGVCPLVSLKSSFQLEIEQ